MPYILIVEDEAAIADALIYALEVDGCSASWVGLAGTAFEFLKKNPVDLVILDVGLPDINGFEACRQLRRISDVPVIFLTARGDEVDRVVGLEIGADDYVVKPFSPREVVARVRAILKRVGPRTTTLVAEKSLNESGEGFQVDPERLQIRYKKQLLSLTRHEFRILQCLLGQPERVFSREQLLESAGVAAEANYERSIDGHIKSLRAKLRQIAPAAEPIQTHRGFGYSFSPTHS